MKNKKYDYFLVRNKDKKLVRFSYNIGLGIYYQIFINKKWSEKKTVYKESFEYFYLIEDFNHNINIFCQDICGDIIICTLEGREWKYKTLFYMKYNVITPIEVKGFFYKDKVNILYNIVDKYSNLEVLVHQSYNKLKKWTAPEIITKLDCHSNLSYDISQNYKYNVILINTMSSGIYKLISRTFNISRNSWGKEKIIYISRLPYIDFSFCISENRSHYLIITEENQLNIVIYQYREMKLNKETRLQKNIILFEQEKVDSCVIMLLDKVLWALWISNSKLYGCFSTNNGQDFSNPVVYRTFDNIVPVKAYYQEYIGDKENSYINNEIYVFNFNEEVHLFLNELLENQVILEEDNDNNSLITNLKDIIYENKSINYKGENLDYKDKKVQECCKKVESINIEKEKLQKKLKVANGEIKKLNEEIKILNETINKQKTQISNLQYKFYKEKDKINIGIKENSILEEKNNYLKNKLLLKDKEKYQWKKD